MTTVAREFYHQLYNEEVALNLTFNTFVANYKAAYEGRNIRKDQVLDTAAKRKFGSRHERKFNTPKKDRDHNVISVLYIGHPATPLLYKRPLCFCSIP